MCGFDATIGDEKKKAMSGPFHGIYKYIEKKMKSREFERRAHLASYLWNTLPFFSQKMLSFLINKSIVCNFDISHSEWAFTIFEQRFFFNLSYKVAQSIYSFGYNNNKYSRRTVAGQEFFVYNAAIGTDSRQEVMEIRVECNISPLASPCYRAKQTHCPDMRNAVTSTQSSQ